MAGKTRASDPDDDAHKQREEQLALYKLAVEEYRFQVNLNWDRSKYLLAFNTVLIGAATGLIRVGGADGHLLIGAIFALGLVAAFLSVLAIRVQQGYYKEARRRMTSLGDTLTLADFQIATTPGARGDRTGWKGRLGKVQTILYILLAVCMAIDAVGIGYAATVKDPPPSTPATSVTPTPTPSASRSPSPPAPGRSVPSAPRPTPRHT